MMNRTWTLLVGIASGVVLGFVAATAGAGAAMREMTTERDQARDRMTTAMNTLMDSAAQALNDEREKVQLLEAQLEAGQPKKVRNGRHSDD